MELIVVLVRPRMSRHHLRGWRPVTRKRQVELVDWTETKEVPKEPGEIVHLGHDDVLLLAAVGGVGARWNEGGGEWVLLNIREWHKHLRGHTGFLVRYLGGREIDFGRGVEGFRACMPNARGWNRSDVFNNNESHWNSGDYARGSTALDQLEVNGMQVYPPRPAPPTSNDVRVIFILSCNVERQVVFEAGMRWVAYLSAGKGGGVQGAIFVLLRFEHGQQSYDARPCYIIC